MAVTIYSSTPSHEAVRLAQEHGCTHPGNTSVNGMFQIKEDVEHPDNFLAGSPNVMRSTVKNYPFAAVKYEVGALIDYDVARFWPHP